MKSSESKRFMSFLIAGGLAALVNFGSRFLYDVFVTYTIAIILAYITGMVTAFYLNKLFVFQKSIHSTRKEFFYFTLVNVLAIVQTVLISLGFYYWVLPWLEIDFYNKSVAHALGVAFPVFTSYFGHKYLSFRSVTS